MDNGRENKVILNKGLGDLKVRPILSEEVAWWNEIMGMEHYLGFRQLIGESL